MNLVKGCGVCWTKNPGFYSVFIQAYSEFVQEESFEGTFCGLTREEVLRENFSEGLEELLNRIQELPHARFPLLR